MMRPSRACFVAFGFAAFALTATLYALSFLLAHGGVPEHMVRVPGSGPPGEPAGFDGQFFLTIALDPLVGQGTVAALDSPVLRARRIGYPLIACMVSRITGEDAACSLLLVQLLCSGALLLALQSVAHAHGLSPTLCFVVPLLLPLALAMELTTAELVATTLLLSGAELDRRGSIRISSLMLSMACLTKEVCLLASLAFTVSALRRGRIRSALWYAESALPLAAWNVYLVIRFGDLEPTGTLLQNLTLPGLGLWRAFVTQMTLLNNAESISKPLAILVALGWHAVGAVLSFRLASQRPLTTGRVLSGLSALLVLVLSCGGAAQVYDEIFNFGRQLFLLVGAIVLVRFWESWYLSDTERRLLTVWLSLGSLLGLGWWIREIAG